VTRLTRDTSTYVFILIASIYMLGWIIPEYTPPYPGYGASPALVAYVAVGIIAVMAVLALIRNALAIWGNKPLSPAEGEYPKDDDGFSQVGRVDLLHLARFLIPPALLFYGFDTIGYISTSILFMLLLQYLVGRREIVPAFVVALATVAFMYVAMRYGFGVPVPGA